MFKIFPKFHNFSFFRNRQKNIQNAIKPELKFTNVSYKSNSYKILNETPVNYQNSTGYIQTTTTLIEDRPQALQINSIVTDDKKETIGFYEYIINKSTATINNGYIETKSPKRGRGIGEILRLSSIIEFMENGIKSLDIEAFPSAIPFHLKCKLKPNLTGYSQTIKILKDINENQNVQPYYRQKAKELTEKIEQENSVILKDKTKEIVNKFIEKFIKQHLQNWDAAKFQWYLPMSLTDSKLKQFADFYNKLFKKHGINYQI